MAPAGAPSQRPKCFIAMPITTTDADRSRYNDEDHWTHVLETLFVRAVAAAGYEPIRPQAVGAHMIHGEIIRNLSEADLVLCDLSAHNPNVFFELGVRTSVNKPISLVRDEHTSIPFDTAGINTFKYNSALLSWEMDEQRDKLSTHITDCAASCAGENPLWRQFGLTIKAQEPVAHESPQEAKLDLLVSQVSRIQHQLAVEQQRRDLERISGADNREFSRPGIPDAHDEPPSNRFQRALRRFTDVNGGATESIALSPSDVLVEFADSAEPFVVDEIHRLAQKYGVKVEISFPYLGATERLRDEIARTRLLDTDLAKDSGKSRGPK